MALPDGFIDELKSRIRLSELVGRTVALKREGREFRGLSPFKKERTPSFFVNDDKQFYHCFSSQKHGDAISWLQETQGLSFMEAVEALAAEAGMEPPRRDDPQAAERARRGRDLIGWIELAHRWFQRQLRGPRGADARAYLARRGLPEADWARFELGYAPDDRRGLKSVLVDEGAPVSALVEAGLLIEPEDRGEPYDRFRNRLMFPIRDPRGRLVAFGGRALSSEARAKYLNSPETPLFHKGATLWRFPEARQAAADPKAGVRGLVVAEGYMDVLALVRAGLPHAVAPLGTALTEEQLRLAWRAGPEPVICLDGDAAGRRAAATAAERALPLLEPGRTLRFVFLPDGLDPDDLLRERGAAALQAQLAATRPLVDVLWERERDLEPLDEPERRAGLRRRLRQLVSRINDADVKAEYAAEIERRLAALFGAPARSAGIGGRPGGWGATRRGRGPAFAPGPTAELKRSRGVERAPAKLRHLLLAAVEWPEIAEAEMETLAVLDCGPLDRLRDAILDACSSGEAAHEGGLEGALSSRGLAADLSRLRTERGPMRAALGGEEAALRGRLSAWRDLASAYMEQTAGDERDEATRARLAEMLGEGDPDRVRGYLAGERRSRVRRGPAKR